MSGHIFDFSLDRDARGVVHVALRGELDLAGAERLQEALEALCAAREPAVVDMRGLTFMDSTGVRLLLQMAERAREDTWALQVVAPVSGEALLTIHETGIANLLPLAGDAPEPERP
jgi:anti-anti-sigma factor